MPDARTNQALAGMAERCHVLRGAFSLTGNVDMAEFMRRLSEDLKIIVASNGDGTLFSMAVDYWKIKDGRDA